MQNNPILIKQSPAHVHVYKTDRFLADLFLGKTKLRTLDESAFEHFDLESYEGKDVPVTILGHSLRRGEVEIAEMDNVFENVQASLIRRKRNPDVAQIAIKGENGKGIVITEPIPLSTLPSHLFDRRAFFPVHIYDDTNWMIVRYANLHQHTDASLLDGIVKVKDLVAKTEWAAAVTDHGNMHAFNEFYKGMKKAGKKPIIGCEVYVETPGGVPRPVLNIDNDDDKTDVRMFDNERVPTSTLNGEHLILLAMNNEGLHNLFQLVTHASEHFYRKPHVTWDLLKQYHTGIVATSACIAGTLGESVKQILKCEANMELPDAASVKGANEKIADQFINQMIALFGKDNFYIELQNHHFPLEDAIMGRIRQYAKRYGLKTTIGVDAHYLNKDDALVHEMWLCQQTKKKMNDPTHMKFSGDGYYVHSSDEVVALFPDDLDALDNSLEIAEKCNVSIESEGYHLPEYPLPTGFDNSRKYLEHLVVEGFNTLWNAGLLCNATKSEYQNRIATELCTIENMGWETYFLVVQDFIHYAEDDNVADHLDRYFPPEYYDQSKIPKEIIKDYQIYIGSGRGSAAGSLVCCCLGITKVDPLKYDLLFERFLSPDRISMPKQYWA